MINKILGDSMQGVELLYHYETRTRSLDLRHLEGMSYRDKRMICLLPHFPAIPATRRSHGQFDQPYC